MNKEEFDAEVERIVNFLLSPKGGEHNKPIDSRKQYQQERENRLRLLGAEKWKSRL